MSDDEIKKLIHTNEDFKDAFREILVRVMECNSASGIKDLNNCLNDVLIIVEKTLSRVNLES